MRAILRKKDLGQLSGWKADSKPRARHLRAVVGAAEVRDDLHVIVGAAVSDVSETFGKLYVQFAAAEYCYLVVSGQLSIDSAEGTSILEPADARDAVAALKATKVESASTDASGSLTLTFADGTNLHARAGADYEAWELRSFDGRLLVSLPGGDIAVFDPSGA